LQNKSGPNAEAMMRWKWQTLEAQSLPLWIFGTCKTFANPSSKDGLSRQIWWLQGHRDGYDRQANIHKHL